jgi:hypothetical protein
MKLWPCYRENPLTSISWTHQHVYVQLKVFLARFSDGMFSDQKEKFHSTVTETQTS